MKLGICYMVFDGEELLQYAIESIREKVDHVSVTYQSISYFGNPASPSLIIILNELLRRGLVDELIHFETDLSIEPRDNELNLRNVGVDASIRAGCSHHISADVDEFYESKQFEHAKKVMESDYDFSIAWCKTYYKEPTYLVVPDQNVMVSLIHPVSNRYQKGDFPFNIERSRRLSCFDRYKVFDKQELVVHHMSYVRKNISQKLQNNCNGRGCSMNKFLTNFHQYQIGDKVCLPPDFLIRRTIQVDNMFNLSSSSSIMS